jgi:acyl-CoA hydrolase
VEFIEDGACIQIGIGAVPDAILKLIGSRKDLGIHSGSIGDGLVDLMESGAVTNAHKPFDRGVSVTGTLLGSARLYRFAHDNPKVLLKTSQYTHGDGLASIPKLVTINSALELDLTGQVNAEQSGDDYLGAIGGQADYVRAGHRSAGGHSIIALQSTAKDGKMSRIRPQLSGPVTSARYDVDVIVTEFGAADLRGLTIPERARRLIAIAHPDFREELSREAAVLTKRGF